jgi:hypothetical protein
MHNTGLAEWSHVGLDFLVEHGERSRLIQIHCSLSTNVSVASHLVLWFHVRHVVGDIPDVVVQEGGEIHFIQGVFQVVVV